MEPLVLRKVHPQPQMLLARSRKSSMRMMTPMTPCALYPLLILDLMRTKMTRRRIWAPLQVQQIRSHRLLHPKRQLKPTKRRKTTMAIWRNTIYLTTTAPIRTPAKRHQLPFYSPTMTMCSWFPRQLHLCRPHQHHRNPLAIGILLVDEVEVAVAVAEVIPILSALQ